MENFKQINNMPKIGFCITKHPLEVGAGMSQEHLKVVKEEFPRNSITFIPFEKIIDNDITAKNRAVEENSAWQTISAKRTINRRMKKWKLTE